MLKKSTYQQSVTITQYYFMEDPRLGFSPAFVNLSAYPQEKSGTLIFTHCQNETGLCGGTIQTNRMCLHTHSYPSTAPTPSVPSHKRKPIGIYITVKYNCQHFGRAKYHQQGLYKTAPSTSRVDGQGSRNSLPLRRARRSLHTPVCPRRWFRPFSSTRSQHSDVK